MSHSISSDQEIVLQMMKIIEEAIEIKGTKDKELKRMLCDMHELNQNLQQKVQTWKLWGLNSKFQLADEKPREFPKNYNETPRAQTQRGNAKCKVHSKLL